ncbi:MAG: Galactose/methyl galactoside import ATP-binding protein MglA [Firmicutes bacterium ADurb.Bin182]|nr:MAG: Galactose/methyl galactoside import ATP-binding protein MglA [Firmicutes bacterium ADurb.Bin182]
MTSEYLLRMEHICKSFGVVKALDDVTFTVRPGTVHALVGENGAGKSTLMNVLFGIHQRDSGEIWLKDKTVCCANPHDALMHGISMVHQELDQVSERTVMENIWLGRYPARLMLVDHKKMYHDTKKIFESMGVDIDPKATVKNLPVSYRQMAEIAKAISYNSDIIVMDEPTSSLTEKEVDKLMQLMNIIRGQGRGIIFITHKLDEVKRIADDITIMRDGKRIWTGDVKEYDINQIVSLMVGREMDNLYPPKDNVPEETVLEVRNLKGMGKNAVKDVSFKLRKGEILGIAGLLGSRRTELVETIFGLRPIESGEILLNGKPIVNKSPQQAIKNGFALVTEERKFNGNFPGMSVLFNALITKFNRRGAYRNNLNLLSSKKMAKDAQWVIDTLRVKTPGSAIKMSKLSGGNQQKVIIGRWLLLNPDILLLDDPTRGIDVGAKYEIYQFIINLAKQGKSIIMISSDMSELFGVADRVMVMSNGYETGCLDRSELNQETIFKLSAQRL